LKELIKQPDAAQSKSDREFWKEVDNLKRFSGFFHPHLVTLLMTWTIKNSYFLLFPLAKYDLNQYLDLKRIPPDPLTYLPDLSMLQWISKQIFGMIGALKTIHNPGAGPSDYLSVEEQKFGRHGDLKPENILWYESSADTKGILVIADLGLAALNTILSRSNISNGKVPGTPQYRPPEHDIVGGQVSRSYDIWTLGCLLLEFVCWALKGPEGRAEFATQRKTIYVNGCISDIFFSVERDNDRDYVMRIKQEVSEVRLMFVSFRAFIY
jgi:serine/threonine protein kinase